MKKIKQIHFWIGVIAAAFLFIESITGILLYFQQGDRENRIPPAAQQQFNGQDRGFSRGDSNAATNNGAATNNIAGNNATQPSINNGQRIRRGGNFQRNREGSLGLSVRSLHSGIIGLIAGFGMLIMTGTGLCLSWIIVRAKRKKKRNMDTKPEIEETL